MSRHGRLTAAAIALNSIALLAQGSADARFQFQRTVEAAGGTATPRRRRRVVGGRAAIHGDATRRPIDCRGRIGRPAAVLGRQCRDPVPVGATVTGHPGIRDRHDASRSRRRKRPAGSRPISGAPTEIDALDIGRHPGAVPQTLHARRQRRSRTVDAIDRGRHRLSISRPNSCVTRGLSSNRVRIATCESPGTTATADACRRQTP